MTATTALRRADNVRLAVVVISLTVLALSLGDALIKLFSADFPLWQIFVLRSLIASPVLMAAIALRAHRPLPRALGWTVLRSLMLVFMWVAYYTALPRVELSVAAAAFYTLPLFITLFAALFLGDAVGWKGWIAVALGFLGVLLILKPQAGAFNAYALLPLVSAVLYASAMILTRSKCRDESPLVLSFTLNLAFIGVGALATWLTWLWQPSGETVDAYRFLLGPWVSMGAEAWLPMGLLAAVIIIGSVGTAIAYQAGPSSIVSTFDFAYLAFAALWGFVLFGEVPDEVTALGIGLIAVAGCLAMRR